MTYSSSYVRRKQSHLVLLLTHDHVLRTLYCTYPVVQMRKAKAMLCVAETLIADSSTSTPLPSSPPSNVVDGGASLVPSTAVTVDPASGTAVIDGLEQSSSADSLAKTHDGVRGRAVARNTTAGRQVTNRPNAVQGSVSDQCC